jgi:hypothetical protein
MRKVTFLLASVLFSICLLFATSTAYAANISEEQLSATEQKLLQKTYPNDPISKRLQRLELSLLGATQYGSDDQRWHNIKSYLSNANNSGKNISSSLNELEKYVFKKTTPAESSAQRLNKLESKLFGKASPSMPTASRVERLQRTLGLTARPDGIAQLPGGMPGMELAPGAPMFGFGNNFGFGDNGMGDPDFNQFDSQMSQLFRQMEQMQQMQQMQPHGSNQPPGYEEHHFYMYSTPDGGFKFGTEPDPNFSAEPRHPKGNRNLNPDKKSPDGKKPPVIPAPQLIPQPNIPQDRIPSYADPNFI